MKVKLRLFLIAFTFFLLFSVNNSDVNAAEISTGFYPVSIIESYVPTAGWFGNPDDIKVNDNIPFTDSYSGSGNVGYINTHINFPVLPNSAIIKRFNFKLKAKHDGGIDSGGGGFVYIRKNCTTGTQSTLIQTIDNIYTTKTFTFSGTGGISTNDINNQTACFSPVISIGPNGINYYDYFEAEIIYELSDPTSTPMPTSVPTQIPTPTATPTPSASPTPAPFLELPFDYQSSGKTFDQVAFNPTSWFDHKYPLQNVACCVFNVLKYDGIETNDAYRSHSGYDYALANGVHFHTPVLAAASGEATFTSAAHSGGAGNIIKIDHRNGYQTWYEHLDNQGLIVSTEGTTIDVQKNQEIGKVGMTGNTNGPHIHLSVFSDKNKNGTFNDDYPYGLNDPLGWEGDSPDPWTQYGSGGAQSYNLFLARAKPIEQPIPTSGGSLDMGKVKVEVPAGASPVFFTLSSNYGPFESNQNTWESIVPSLFLKAFDSLNNNITQFFQPIKLSYNYSDADLLNIKEDTLTFTYYNEETKVWVPLSTAVNTSTKIATAQTTHFSHFALMGEVKDKKAPTTEISIQGDKGQDNWYRSSVSVELKAKDTDGGLGVDSTLYTLNGSDWFKYTSPIILENQGNYKITYQSIDKAYNLEEQKMIELHIDKTSPEANIMYDLSKYGIVVTGSDDAGSATIAIDDSSNRLNKIYTIRDKAGNKLVITANELIVGKQITQTIRSLQYNNNPIVRPDRNIFFTFVLADKNDKVKQLDQYFSIQGEERIFSNYSANTNKTVIYKKGSGVAYVREDRAGLVLLKLKTKIGELLYTY